MKAVAQNVLTNDRSVVEELAEDYPTYFDVNNLTITDNNYFLVASKYYLGTAQTNQFQSGNQYGNNWRWTTQCSNPGICDSSSSYNRESPLVDMPRSYHNDESDFYNWFAAMAGSGQYYSPNDIVISDSLCPAGWSLPETSNTSSKPASWGLLSNAYAFSDNANGSSEARKLSVSLRYAGRYGEEGIPANNRAGDLYWSSTTHTRYSTARDVYFTDSRFNVYDANMWKITGLNILCAKSSNSTPTSEP